MALKESDVTRSMLTVVSHVKNQTKNNVVLANQKGMFGDLNARQIEKICSIIESSIEQAATAAIASEARGLAKASE
jgi:hypothetical protein